MNKKIKLGGAAAYTLGEKIKKDELLDLIKVLAPSPEPPKSIRNAGKVAQPKKTSYITRQSQLTRNLLRRYFVMRIAQIY